MTTSSSEHDSDPADEPRSDYTGVDLSGVDLSGANLTRARLTGVNLSGSILRDARLTAADLTEANLTNATLAGADLTNATLAGADLTNATLAGADLTDATLAGANLTGANLTGANLMGANLMGANLMGARMKRTTLVGVITGDIIGDPKSLPAGWRAQSGHLVGPGANLADADLCTTAHTEHLSAEQYFTESVPFIPTPVTVPREPVPVPELGNRADRVDPLAPPITNDDCGESVVGDDAVPGQETSASASSRLLSRIGGSLWLALVVGLQFVLQHFHAPAAIAVLSFSILCLPGAAFLALLGVRPVRQSSRLVLAVSISMILVMLVDLLASFLGPLFGVHRPLDRPEQLWILGTLTGSLVLAGMLTARDPVQYLTEGMRPSGPLALIGFAALPVGAVLGAARLNAGGSNSVALVTMAASIMIILIAGAAFWRRSTRFPLSPLFYCTTLALLLATTLRSNHLFGWDIQQEYGVGWPVIHAGIWKIPTNHDAYASMLSLTALPASLQAGAGLSLQLFLRVLTPMLLALVPVALFAVVRSKLRFAHEEEPARDGLSLLLVSSMIVFSVVFPTAMPCIARQSLALTLVAALITVLVDPSINRTTARAVAMVLLVGISFTHYTTSFIVAGLLTTAWVVAAITAHFRQPSTRPSVLPARIITITVVLIALGSALEWNLAITRNDALSRPASTFAVSGVNLQASTTASMITPLQYQTELHRQLAIEAPWIKPRRGAVAFRLAPSAAPTTKSMVPGVTLWWNRTVFLAHEGIIVIEAAAAAFLAMLWYRRRQPFSADLFGLSVAGLALGVAMRFSGTMAQFFNPERGSLVTAIFLIPSAALALDWTTRRFKKTTFLPLAMLWLVLAASSSGLAVLLAGGTPHAALSTTGEDVERFAVSAPEFTTAAWMNTHLPRNALVQSDRYGQLALLNFQGHYSPLPELVPADVDRYSYIYASRPNIVDHRARGGLNNGRSLAIFTFPQSFFDTHLSIIYSTGSTRVLH